jgi:hypothetical protein
MRLSATSALYTGDSNFLKAADYLDDMSCNEFRHSPNTAVLARRLTRKVS